jgi:hypothetical protein
MYSRTPSAERIFGTSLAVDVVNLDLARRRLPLALLGIVGRERARRERHHRAAVARRARLAPENHILGDTGDDARRRIEGRLPDLQRVEDARARRTCGIGEQRFVVCRHGWVRNPGLPEFFRSIRALPPVTPRRQRGRP